MLVLTISLVNYLHTLGKALTTYFKMTTDKNLAPCGTEGRLLLTGFQLLVTLTLTLDRVIRHTVVRHSSTFIYIPSFIEIGKTSLWMD